MGTGFPYPHRYLYAMGKDPARSLARDVPNGQDADILVIGAVDVQHVLYTAYQEVGLPSRKLDITCCEHSEQIIARSLILYTLILDGNVSADDLWPIQYHALLRRPTVVLVGHQLDKLLRLAETLETWGQSPYGERFQFCDDATFADVRTALQQMRDIITADPGDNANNFGYPMNAIYRFNLGNTLKIVFERQEITGLNDQAFRSVAPLGHAAGTTPDSIDLLFRSFWNSGTTDTRGPPAFLPNPTLATALLDRCGLVVDTNPLLGFHLGTARAPLRETSPLRPDPAAEDPAFLNAAKTQWRAWIDAYRQLKDRIILRLIDSDALAFGHTLQHCIASSGQTCANWYRRQFDSRILTLGGDYARPHGPPRTFDVIDATSVASFKTLSLLASMTPLLKSEQWATLTTVFRIGLTITNPHPSWLSLAAEYFSLPIPTLFVLLGVYPVEFWTDATAVSPVEDVFLGIHRRPGVAEAAKGALLTSMFPLSWKREGQLSGNSYSNLSTLQSLSVEPAKLAYALFEFYREMFIHDEIPGEMARDYRIFADRANFIAIMKLIIDRFAADRNAVLTHFIGEVEKEVLHAPAPAHAFEGGLTTQIGIQFDDARHLPIHTLSGERTGNPEVGAPHCWSTPPNVVAITLVVPRVRYEALFPAGAPETGFRPLLRVAVGPGNLDDPHGRMMSPSYIDDLQVTLGRVRGIGHRKDRDFSIEIEDDPNHGDFIVSLYLAPGPFWRFKPSELRVGLRVAPVYGAAEIYGDDILDENMTVFERWWSDEANVYFSRFMPGQTGYRTTMAAAPKPNPPEAPLTGVPVSRTYSVGFTGAEVDAITAQVDIIAPAGRTLLADKAVPVQLQQPKPNVINLILGRNKFIIPLQFPAPVDHRKARTRIARKSHWIQVIAAPETPRENEDAQIGNYVYPTAIRSLPNAARRPPATLNISHLNLDRLPTLDLADTSRLKWLNTLTGLQFNLHERRMRDAAANGSGITPSARTNFKESLFTMFMLVSGLQGGQTGLFSLKDAKGGTGIHMLIFVSAMRLDGANASVVLDAAALPLTKQLIESKQIEGFLLLLRTLECCTLEVDEAEMLLWKHALPALAERCRTWSHTDACEYQRPGATIPLSTEMGAQVLCRCGNGHLPEAFISLPDWDESVAPHAVRIAISPTYWIALPDDLDTIIAAVAPEIREKSKDFCRSCGAVEALKADGTRGGPLKTCMRCKKAKYCSGDCQKRDWRKHRAECQDSEDLPEAPAVD